MIKNTVYYYAIVVFIIVAFIACGYDANNDHMLHYGVLHLEKHEVVSLDDYEESPLADVIRTMPFFADKIFMDVVSITTDRVQLRIENNADMSIRVAFDFIRRRDLLYPGPFTSSGSFHVDFFEGQNWRLLTPYPITRAEVYPSDWQGLFVSPGDYVIFNYCMKPHTLPKYGIDHYRIVLDVFPTREHVTPEMRRSLREYQRAGGDIIFHTAGWPRHAVVAEFYWSDHQ